MPSIFTEFELDSDDLDDDTVAHTNLEHGIRRGDPPRAVYVSPRRAA